MNEPILAADRAWCRAALPRVSRTFALNIRVLADPFRGAVETAYLLCRAADALEDSWPGSPAAIGERFLPNVTTTLRFEGAERRLPSPTFSNAYPAAAGRTIAYVCKDFTCGPPAGSVEELLRLLGET